MKVLAHALTSIFKRRSANDDLSLTKAVPIMRRDLDALSGVWTAKDANEFDRALARQRTIDPKQWR